MCVSICLCVGVWELGGGDNNDRWIRGRLGYEKGEEGEGGRGEGNMGFSPCEESSNPITEGISTHYLKTEGHERETTGRPGTIQRSSTFKML